MLPLRLRRNSETLPSRAKRAPWLRQTSTISRGPNSGTRTRGRKPVVQDCPCTDNFFAHGDLRRYGRPLSRPRPFPGRNRGVPTAVGSTASAKTERIGNVVGVSEKRNVAPDQGESHSQTLQRPTLNYRPGPTRTPANARIPLIPLHEASTGGGKETVIARLCGCRG